MVHPPSPAHEDARRPHRERQRLIKERGGHVNRIKGLLATQGIYYYQPLRRDRHSVLAELTAADGQSLPPGICRELERELIRLDLVLDQIRQIEAKRDTALEAAKKNENSTIARLVTLKSIGPDTFRIYEMSMGPLDLSRPWETRAVVGSLRVLQRLWRNIISEETGETTVSDIPPDDESLRVLHRTIAAVRRDVEALRFNTAIARLIELNNHLTRLKQVPRDVAEALVLMIAPFAPHIAEELWSRLGHAPSLAYIQFPQPNPKWLVEETVTCVVQVAGKLRDRLEVSPDADEETLRKLALASDAVQRAMAGRPLKTIIVRAPKLVNVVPE